MVPSAPTTVERYLASLPPDRRAAISQLRALINEHLPRGYEEGMQYGMIGWYIPLSRYPETYNGQPLAVAGLASQKQHMSLYLMCAYGNPKVEQRFRDRFKAAGKKLDMGKSCVRFKTIDALALDAIAEVIAAVGVDAYISFYEQARGTTTASTRKAAPKPRAAKVAKRPAEVAKRAAQPKPAKRAARPNPAKRRAR